MNSDKSDFVKTAKSGFIIWSWVALLGAYTSTSALLFGLAYSMLQRGIKAFDYGSISLALALVSVFFPMAFLVLGWLVFYRYSTVVYEYSIIDPTESGPDPKMVVELFRRSLSYIIYTYMVGLLLGVLTLALNIFQTLPMR